MPVCGCFIGEFGATIIAFVFPATIPRRPATTAAATAATAFVVATIIRFVFHHQCHTSHIGFIIFNLSGMKS
jgi:hypothetical protein